MFSLFIQNIRFFLPVREDPFQNLRLFRLFRTNSCSLLYNRPHGVQGLDNGFVQNILDQTLEFIGIISQSG
jgi:ribosomal protein L30/L7E